MPSIPRRMGTKAAAHYQLNVGAGKTATIRLRLSDCARLPPWAIPSAASPKPCRPVRARRTSSIAAITPERVSEDEARVMRQALAGMLWSKQYFFFDVDKWLKEHGADPMKPGTQAHAEQRMVPHGESTTSSPCRTSGSIPWYAAWDLAFHTIALSTVDADFAKEQLDLMLQEFFLHPTGQIPAYEWNFSDVNPPVHAWATIFLTGRSRRSQGKGDIEFLKRSFAKLMLNFSWWVNRKDRFGNNLFEGGFLGLDNIGVFDRSAPLPTGGHLEQADGTAWVALFCQNMLEIAVELAAHDPFYRRHGREVCGPFPLDRPRHESDRAGWHVGRGRWVLLRRPAPSRRQCAAAQGSLHGGPASLVCHHGDRALAARTGARSD